MKDRENDIISTLMNSDHYIPFKQLSRSLKVSERTIRYEVDSINDLLNSYHLPLIEQKRGIGIKFQLNAEQRQFLKDELEQSQKLGDYYPPEERFISLLFSMLEPKEKTLLYVQEKKLNVSKSTLDEDMKKMRVYLAKYSLAAKSLPKEGVIVEGNERFVRTMLYDTINKSVDFHRIIEGKHQHLFTKIESTILDYLDKETVEVVRGYYDSYFSEGKFHANEFYVSQMILITTIWIGRIQRNEMIKTTYEEELDIRSKEIKGFIHAIIKKFNLGIKILSTNELKYIVFILNSFNPETSKDAVDWINAQLMSLQLINDVEEKVRIPFSKEESLFEGVYKHMIGLLNRLENNVFIYNPLKDTIKENYSEIYKAVAHFRRRIEKGLSKQISDDEIAYLTIYFSTAKTQIEKQGYFMYRVAVVCDHGLATGKLLAVNLEEQFNIDVVAVLSSHDVQILNKLKVDLVFKTVDIKIPEIPNFKTAPIFSDSNITEITNFLDKNKSLRKIEQNALDATLLYQKILNVMAKNNQMLNKNVVKDLEKIFKENHLTINKKEIQPMLEDVLSDNLIILQHKSESWQEAVKDVAQPLLTAGFIEKSYIDAMIKSVIDFGPYIVIGPHIALAHARPEKGVNKLGVSVMTLKDPLNFGNEDNDPVSIIFCLAAADDYSHLNIMKSIVELINNVSKVQELVKISDIKQFKKLLFSKEATK